MSELAKRTWVEAAEDLGPATVALLPIGSTEPHGPHLPLDVDVTIALAMARRAAERLSEAGAVPLADARLSAAVRRAARRPRPGGARG